MSEDPQPPDREAERLRVLRSFDILDTEEEATFDDFTKLVSQLLDVPIALISLVDDRRQWFKSYVGLDVRETDRDIAFCDTAIRGFDPLIVCDATEDERFCDNPLVTDDPRIRFYAGVPLVSIEGQAIGTLCAIDTEPRELAPAQIEVLEILARQVMAQLQLRRVTARSLRAEVKRLRLEAKLQETQRLDSLAVLAGGIAHDFNNLLVSILGNANIASLELPPESAVRSTIAKIEAASMRAADLTKQLLAYAGAGSPESRIVNLSKLVAEMGHLIEVAISRKVVLNFDLAKEDVFCRVDATQIRQVIMNLLINASEAIGSKSGMVAVRTGVKRLGPDYIRETMLHDRVQAGDFAFVEVSDTGCGMDETTRARMFDPFFTTKDTGSGLGLAAVLGIVRAHGGTIVVYSAEGKGTTIRLLFPSVGSALDQEAPRRPHGRGRGELLLVVDDEEHVRNVASRLLEQLGFAVMTAHDGDAGVSTYLAHRDSIRLVLMDITMPVRDGITAFKDIRAHDPDVEVIMMSGLAYQDISPDLAGRTGWSFLQKPFTRVDLMNTVRRALEGGAESSATH